MTEKGDLTSEHCLLSMRVPRQLYSEIECDAAALQVSVSAAARMRLRTGSAAVMPSNHTRSNDGHT